MKPGDVVVDRFEVLQLAGQGGMGAVFRARDRQTGEQVALKSLTDPGGNHVERFEREAQVLHDLHHTGIVRYVAHGRTKSGELYMAMEWVDGESISQRGARKPFTVREATQVVLQIASALAEAHRQGVIHRDIKPSNLFLRRGSLEVKVLDFGIARLSQAARLTGLGMMLGTPGYMAPEQARGAATVDSRADIFSLGCVFFKCLTGRPPFMSEDVRTVLAQVLFDPAPPVSSLRPEVPPQLDALVARMLAKKPPDRPTDGAAIAAELEAIYPTLLDLPAVEVEASQSFVPPPLPPPPPPPAPPVLKLAQGLSFHSARTAKEIPVVQFRLPEPVPAAVPPAASRPEPAPMDTWSTIAGEVPDAPTGVEVSPFASAPVFAPAMPTSEVASPFAVSELPSEPVTGGAAASATDGVWEAPTYVRAVLELPEATEVVSALTAAKTALAGGHLDSAMAEIKRGLERAQGPLIRGSFLALQSEAQLWRGDLDGATTQANAALSLLSLDRPEWGVAVAALGRASARRGDQGKLKSLAYLLLEMDTLRAPQTLLSAAVVCLELLRLHEDELAERLEEAIRAGDHADEEVPEVKAALLHLWGGAAALRGDFSAGVEQATAAAAAFLAAGSPLGNHAAALDAAVWSARVGQLEAADAQLGELLSAARRNRERWLELEASLEWAAVAWRLGRVDEGLRLAKSAIDMAVPAMGQLASGRAHLLMADLLDQKGKREEAAAAATKAAGLLPPGVFSAAVLTTRSRIALAQGSKAEALERAREAVRWFDQSPRIPEREMEARLALARALFACGLNDSGREELNRACERLRTRTAAIGQAAQRSPFLTRLGEHRQLLELAAWWLGQAVG